MMRKALPVSIGEPTLDIVGTGGDRLGTVNISTMSSLVAAGAGATVVKHGNRGASSTAGAADVIEALGVDLSLGAERVARAASEVGITFLFAQSFHPSMRFVGPARRQLGVRTVFNFLGPLANPAQVTAQALGCASRELAPRMAEVLAARGTRGIVFRGQDGRDKITISAATDLWEVRDGALTIWSSPRRMWASAAARWMTSAAEQVIRMQRPSAACSAGSTASSATPCCSTPPQG